MDIPMFRTKCRYCSEDRYCRTPKEYAIFYDDDAILNVRVKHGDDLYPLPHIVRHSPTGFNIGYAGSGPQDLSLSILTDLYSPKIADEFYNQFTHGLISTLELDTSLLMISESLIDRTLALQYSTHVVDGDYELCTYYNHLHNIGGMLCNGTRVRIKHGLTPGHQYNGITFVQDMVKYMGHDAKITSKVRISGVIGYRIDVDCEHYCWSKDMLEVRRLT